jgi:hypothetical protein
MKKKILICIGTVLIVILASFSVSAIIQSGMVEEENEKETQESLPEHISWNADLGEYYNSDDYIWNSESKRYEVRLDNKELPPVDQVMTIQKWLEENKDSEDYITCALLEFYRRQNEYFVANREIGLKSQVIISDHALDALRDLGYSSMIDMYERIIEKDYMQAYLMKALMDMLEISIEFVPSHDEQERARWMDSFESKVIEASEAKISSVSDVEKYGIFSVVSVLEQDVESQALTSSSEATAKAVNALMTEKGITEEDISAIRAFGEYIKAVHAKK